MLYRFIDSYGTFRVINPHRYNFYLPLTNATGTLLSSISPNLAGDIKKDNEHFLSIPASIEDTRSNLLCRREFFLTITGKHHRLSSPGKDDTLTAGLLYQTITKIIAGLRVEILNFIPHDADAEVMRITVTNTSRKAIEIIPTSFLALYGRSEKNLRDHRHVSSLLNRVTLTPHGIQLKPTMIFDEKGHTLNTTIYYAYGFEGNKKAPAGQFPTLDYFFGANDILAPEALQDSIAPVTKKKPEFDGKEACAALRFSTKKLSPGQSATYTLIFGITESSKDIPTTCTQLDTIAKVDKKLAETQQYWRQYLSRLTFDFKNTDFNNWLLWVRLQPTLRKLFGCSFLPHFDYGKGGRGWRDLWQDALTLLLTEPDKARNFILKNFKGVRVDGSNATIIAKDGEFISDRNRIDRVWMDHGVWPYLTTRFYIHKTGDLDILTQKTTYFRDHQLRRAQEHDAAFTQDDCLLRAKGTIYEGTVLEHLLVQALTQFFNVGEHNIIRLENADWNDGLDMAPQRGESVTFSSMYAYTLGDICTLLTALKQKWTTVSVFKELAILLDSISGAIDYNNPRARQELLKRYFDALTTMIGEATTIAIDALIADLTKKSEHLAHWIRTREWLPCGFFNGYYDNRGERVEGRRGTQVRMMLPPQVFAIMSGVASDEQIAAIWSSAKRYLKDKRLGGFRLNTDFGEPLIPLGRAFGFSYGDKENGAFFNHMTILFANALYKRGFITQAFEVMNSIHHMATAPGASIPPVLPEYFNNQGQGLYLYLTGSASWYTYTVLEEILGIKFSFGDIVIEPKLVPENFAAKTITITFPYAGKTITTVIQKGQACTGAYRIKTVFLDTKEISPQDKMFYIRKNDLTAKKAHSATITVALA